MENQPNENDILSENVFENVQASTGKRFGNYLIDLIIVYIIVIGLGIVYLLINPAAIDDIDDNTAGNNLLDRLLFLIVYGIIMGIVEGIGKGKTIGKLITGTRAINEDGSRITFSTGFVRGLCRAVPFNQLSALGSPSYPWHDKWTNTIVIDEKLSNFKERL